MARAILDGRAISDWDSFHSVSAKALGFPAFYGRNLDAWIDCLTYLRDGDGMSRFQLAPGESLIIEVLGSADLKRSTPDVYKALVESTAFVNKRYIEAGDQPPLQLEWR